MSEPVIASKIPLECELEAGKSYWWCACGRSRNQPWCDGSHAGTEFTPHEFKVESAGKYFLCACKHTTDAPFCDGAHDLLD
ncbi:MAG: CDGSH iron-sulfur domain-containing protein [Betaproteobacteria bacterium]|nr:CDGSH iron-sulfur domain-containing protein [Betaproteobacteria bacterium]